MSTTYTTRKRGDAARRRTIERKQARALKYGGAL